MMTANDSTSRLLELLLKLWGALPPRFIRWAAKWSALLWYKIDRRHRKVAKDNIRLALGYTSEERISSLAKANFVHLTTVFLETLGVARITRHNCDDFVNVSGTEYLFESLDRGKGLFLLTGHLGNWEWLAYMTPFYIQNRLNVIVRPLNWAWPNKILTNLRERSGNRIIDKKKATKLVFKALQDNEMVGILLDQVSSRGEGVYAPFFGVYALTNRALASLAIKTGSPVHPAFIRRRPNGKYCVVIGPPIPIPGNGSLKDRIFQATSRFNAAIEQQIRTDPTQWYWIHRRFKRHMRNLAETAETATTTRLSTSSPSPNP